MKLKLIINIGKIFIFNPNLQTQQQHCLFPLKKHCLLKNLNTTHYYCCHPQHYSSYKLEKVGSHNKKAIDLNQQNMGTQNHNHRHRNKCTTILIFGNVAKRHIDTIVHAREV